MAINISMTTIMTTDTILLRMQHSTEFTGAGRFRVSTSLKEVLSLSTPNFYYIVFMDCMVYGAQGQKTSLIPKTLVILVTLMANNRINMSHAGDVVLNSSVAFSVTLL